MKIYLAGPIFTYGDLLRNTEWAKKIREEFPGVDLYSPVENTEINGVEGKKKFAGSREIAKADNARLNDTDILIACIDGDVLPSGTCSEIGKFHEKIERGDHKYIVGICTDNRQMFLTHSEAKDKGGAASLGEQQYSYQNLYVTGLIKEGGTLVSNIDDAIDFIKDKCKEFKQEYLTRPGEDVYVHTQSGWEAFWEDTCWDTWDIPKVGEVKMSTEHFKDIQPVAAADEDALLEAKEAFENDLNNYKQQLDDLDVEDWEAIEDTLENEKLQNLMINNFKLNKAEENLFKYIIESKKEGTFQFNLNADNIKACNAAINYFISKLFDKGNLYNYYGLTKYDKIAIICNPDIIPETYLNRLKDLGVEVVPHATSRQIVGRAVLFSLINPWEYAKSDKLPLMFNQISARMISRFNAKDCLNILMTPPPCTFTDDDSNHGKK